MFTMKPIMTKLFATIKRMLNALACADAGEYLTPRQKARYLDRDDSRSSRS